MNVPFIASVGIVVRDAATNRKLFKDVLGLPFTSSRSASNPNAQKKTFRCVSTSISRLVREIVE